MTTYPAMSPDVELLFNRLQEYVLQLRYEWATFQALYGTSSTVEVVNKIAPDFFGREQGRLQDAVFLGIARLFDPASSGGPTKTNLTLLGLADLLKSSHTSLTSQIESAFGKAVVDGDPVKTAIKNERHKRIAHLDRATAFGTNVLTDVTRDAVEIVISEIESIMNQIENGLRGSTTYYGAMTTQAKQNVNRLLLGIAIVADMTPQEIAERQLKLGQSSTVG